MTNNYPKEQIQVWDSILGSRLLTVCAVVVSLFSGIAQGAEKQKRSSITFYVATDGDDAWSGLLSEPNRKKTDGPFASIHQARDAIRERKANGVQPVPINVLLRGGKYYLKDTLYLGPEDSGTPDCPITYRAYANEKPILSGGRVLTTWKRHKGNIWSCSLEACGLSDFDSFKQLFYRRKRQIVARYPNIDVAHPRTGGFLYMNRKLQKDKKWFLWYPAGDLLHRWAKPNEVEVNHFQSNNWTNRVEPLSRIIDKEARIIAPAEAGGPVSFSGNRFYIQNAIEELDTSGEWYLDRDTKTVFFLPPDKELVNQGAVIPAVMSVIVVRGDFEKKKFVENVVISHLGVECCEQHGITLEACRHCQIIGCSLEQIGRTGIVIGAGSLFCRISGNDIAYPGGHGIAMYDDVVSPKACSDNVLTNNHAHHCGEHYVSSFGWGSGICISGHRNLVAHNLVHDTAYNPMNFTGWDNVIEYNHFHHGNWECSDCGGIYGWANRKGGSGRNTIRYNHIHDIVGYGKTWESPDKFLSPNYSWGIYLDDYLSETIVFGNLVYRTAWGGLMIHGGSKNIVENNIFAEGKMWQLWCANMIPSSYPGVKHYPEAKPASMFNNQIQRNIFYCKSSNQPVYRGVSWLNQAAKFKRNLIFIGDNPLKVELRREGETDSKMISWKQWLAQGQDRGSIIADPLFINPENNDFRLQPNSPSRQLDFKSLPIKKMGLMDTVERASWPVYQDSSGREKRPHRG